MKRDPKTGEAQPYIACPPCALVLRNQVERARKRYAAGIQPRARKVPRKAIEALRDGLDAAMRDLDATEERERAARDDGGLR